MTAHPYATAIQTDTSRCLVCGRKETRDAPLIAVLTANARKNEHHWLCRSPCAETHSAKCQAEREAAVATRRAAA